MIESEIDPFFSFCLSVCSFVFVCFFPPPSLERSSVASPGQGLITYLRKHFIIARPIFAHIFGDSSNPAARRETSTLNVQVLSKYTPALLQAYVHYTEQKEKNI